MKLYDVWFNTNYNACVTIEAKNKAEAIEKLENMPNYELLPRIKNSLDYGGIKVKKIEFIENVE